MERRLAMKRKTKTFGAGVSSVVLGCALAMGCSAAPAGPEEATGTATQPLLSSATHPAWSPYCSSVNTQCSTWDVPSSEVTQAERDLVDMGCDYPTIESAPVHPGYAGYWWERYTTCPSHSAAVANWVAQYSGFNDRNTFGAHFNDAACDACIPRLPYGRDYVFYDGKSERPLCQGCPIETVEW
jgi:hypothetical protein